MSNSSRSESFHSLNPSEAPDNLSVDLSRPSKAAASRRSKNDVDEGYIETNKKTASPPSNIEAMQKLAYTDIWVNSQTPKPVSSIIGTIAARLDSYFNFQPKASPKSKVENKKKSDDVFSNVKPSEFDMNDEVAFTYMRPKSKTPSLPDSTVDKLNYVNEINGENEENTSEEDALTPKKSDYKYELQTKLPDNYVSPFEDLPREPPVPSNYNRDGKKYVSVPAGFDLTTLVKYKDPNHWHRRATTRYDDTI